MSQPKVETLTLMYKITSRRTLDIAQGIAEAKRFHQIAPGKAHPAWQLGHLGFSLDIVVCGMVLGQPSELPEEYLSLFSPSFMGGAEIVPDPAKYPDWDTLIQTYKTQAKRVLTLVSALRDDELSGEIRGQAPETLRSRFSTLDIALGFFVTHDAYHCGQMALIANAPD